MFEEYNLLFRFLCKMQHFFPGKFVFRVAVGTGYLRFFIFCQLVQFLFRQSLQDAFYPLPAAAAAEMQRITVQNFYFHILAQHLNNPLRSEAHVDEAGNIGSIPHIFVQLLQGFLTAVGQRLDEPAPAACTSPFSSTNTPRPTEDGVCSEV